MRQFLTYLLICTYLFSFPEARQVLRLPNLVEHFISHNLKDSNTTLYSFVKMHYLDEQQKDSDYNQDMKLPFKSHEVCAPSVPVAALPSVFSFSFDTKSEPVSVVRNFIYSEKFYPSVFGKVWQPPKLS